MKLTWADLLIQNIPLEDVLKWIEPWAPLVSGQFALVFMSKFGNWFLRRRDGTTDELSVIDGTLQRVANNDQEFAACVNRIEWQEEHLLSFHVLKLHERGLIPGPGECYAFAPHPVFTGRIELSHAHVTSIPVWQSIAAQSYFPASQ
jgi:hypothetical protein